MKTKIFDNYIRKPITKLDRESRTELADDKLDAKIMWVCFIVALDLTLIEYFGLGSAFRQYFGQSLQGSEWFELYRLSYWSGSCIIGYFIIPSIVILVLFKGNLLDYGLRIKGVFKHFWLYLLMFAGILPLVIIMSAKPEFQATYPFYFFAARSPYDFWVWEGLYAAQFFALEFFFRGFCIHGLKHRFGFYSVFIAVIPYCMIHFGKPFPETLGAIIAGLVLGTLSLKTGSIWLGFLIHVSVALSMDVAALFRRGALERLWDLGLLSWFIN